MAFYLLFIVSVMIFGSIMIGPISLRVLATIIMIAYLCLQYKRIIYRAKHSYILIYILFIILLGIALVFSGDFASYGYAKQVLAFFLVAIVAYYATMYFITTQTDITSIYITLIVILILTSITTIWQFQGNPLGWQIGMIFNDVSTGLEDKIHNYELNQDNLLGVSYAVGLFGHPVSNAMYISTLSVLPLFNMIHSKSLLKRIIYFAIFLMGLTACFMTQQRSAFYILLIVSALTTILLGKHRILLVLCGLVVIIVAWPTIQNLAISDNLGRLSLENIQTDETRQSLWNNAELFIYDNLLWGGPMTFMRFNNGFPPHNFFYGAFINGGLIGGIIIILLFLKICKDAIIIIIRNRRKNNYAAIFSLALLVFLAQGLFHTGTLLDGEAIIFILLAICISADTFQKQTL